MAKYRVLSGIHLEVRNGVLVEYKVGDVIESDLELDKRFPHKFELLQVANPPESPTRESRLDALRRRVMQTSEGQ